MATVAAPSRSSAARDTGVVAGQELRDLWLAALVVAGPYLWFLARGVGAFTDAMGAAALAGTLVAVTFTALGIVISSLARSNRLSLSVSLFTLLALYTPTQLPAGAKQGWAAELLLRVNPVTAPTNGESSQAASCVQPCWLMTTLPM